MEDRRKRQSIARQTDSSCNKPILPEPELANPFNRPAWEYRFFKENAAVVASVFICEVLRDDELRQTLASLLAKEGEQAK